MKKKAQAAMEFLMTYGWAILVVLIVIGALAYFGVLNPQNLLPEKCTLPVGLSCDEHVVRASSTSGANDGTINLIITNGIGEGIIFTEMNVTGDLYGLSGTPCALDAAGLAALPDSESPFNGVDGLHFANGATKTVTMTCEIGQTTGKTRGVIKITYCTDTLGDQCSTFSHPVEG
ncbi:MAG TPA: hypothetical protein ENL45_01785, partial [Candidatus Woesearchaeota archaeon]|nr:hypothetical protein [Candidatus Woesearchaeota archaeon]